MHAKFWLVVVKRKEYLKNLGIYGRIILNCKTESGDVDEI
jgi:hypothetical protein